MPIVNNTLQTLPAGILYKYRHGVLVEVKYILAGTAQRFYDKRYTYDFTEFA